MECVISNLAAFLNFAPRKPVSSLVFLFSVAVCLAKFLRLMTLIKSDTVLFERERQQHGGAELMSLSLIIPRSAENALCSSPNAATVLPCTPTVNRANSRPTFRAETASRSAGCLPSNSLARGCPRIKTNVFILKL